MSMWMMSAGILMLHCFVARWENRVPTAITRSLGAKTSSSMMELMVRRLPTARGWSSETMPFDALVANTGA